MPANPSRWAVDLVEYLRFEREAAERHELIDGEIVAIAGATRRHNLLCGRLHRAIRPALREGRRPAVRKLAALNRVVDAAGRYTGARESVAETLGSRVRLVHQR